MFRAVATISAFSILSRFLSFIYKIYLSNQISTAELGVYSVATSICMIFLTLLTAGLPLIVSRSTAESIITKDFKKTHNTISAGILYSLILSVFVTLFILIFKPLFYIVFADSDSYLVLLTLIPFLISSGIYAPIKGFLWGNEDYFSVSVVELSEQIIKIIICVVLFALIKDKNLPAGLSMSISCICSTVLGFAIYFKKKGKLTSPFTELKNVVKSTAPISAIRVAGSLLQPLISIVLPLRLVVYGYSNTQAMSLLGVAMGMTFPLLTIPTTLVGSLAMALTPKLTILQKQNNNSSLKNQIVSSTTFTLFCCFLFVPIFYALGVPMCEFLFHNNLAGELISKFSWVVVPMGLSQISTSILNSLGEEKFVFYSYFASSFIIVLSILFLPKYIGISALLVGFGLQNLAVAIVNYIKINRILNNNAIIVPLIAKFTIISLICSLISKWIYALLILFLNSFISMIIIGVMEVFEFTILCYAFGIFNFQLYFQKKKLKS